MITNVEPRAERHHAERARIAFETSVELSHRGFDDDAFEADAVDLSSGGLALRSPCLPDVGEHLTCRFEAFPGGTRVESRGEVVWTHADGERSGEFGLRFLDIDAQARALIDEMIAERRAETMKHSPSAPGSLEELRVAELELAGVAAPLPARILRTGGGEAVFEQRMDLLELGRAVVARAGSALGKGRIADVALRMDGETPTLAVTVRFEQGKSLFGEFDWESQTMLGQQARQDEPPVSDTVPDLEAPTPASVDKVAPSHVTVMEFEASGQPAVSEPATEASTPLPAPAHPPVETASAPVVDAQVPPVVSSAAKTAAQAPAQPKLLVSDDDAWAHPLPEDARSSALVRFLRIAVAITLAVRSAGSLLLAHAWPKLTALFASSRPLLVAFYTRRALPFARNALYFVSHKLEARPRRTTTAPAAQRKTAHEESGVVRLAVIGVLAACAIGLGVYAVAPASDEGQVPVHRKITRAKSEAEAATVAEAAAVPPTAAAAPAPAAVAAPVAATGAQPAKINPAYASAMMGQVAAPAPAALPVASPYAVDVRDPKVAGELAPSKPSATAAKTVTSGPSFGAKIVNRPQRFTLRMTSAVKTLSGSSDRTGFTVVVPGALSLDRASPIAASHKSVARAMVLNKGDRSELSVRFVDGKSPAFRVNGRGAELEVLIAE